MPTVEQFAAADEGCLMKLIPMRGRDIGRFASHRNSAGREYLSAGGTKNFAADSIKTLLACWPSAHHAATFRSLTGKGCCFLVFVQLFEKYGTDRESVCINRARPCAERLCCARPIS
eukprot:SAG31_NODE_244_length_19246_cov_20.233823_22_plen_117_part_00